MRLRSRDFDDRTVDQLRHLSAELAAANQLEAVAQAASVGLSPLTAERSRAAAAATATDTAAAANLASALAARETLKRSRSTADEALNKARLIRRYTEALGAKALDVREAYVDALTQISALCEVVARRRGKNEALSPLIVSGAETLTAHASVALGAITVVAQQIALALVETAKAERMAHGTAAEGELLESRFSGEKRRPGCVVAYRSEGKRAARASAHRGVLARKAVERQNEANEAANHASAVARSAAAAVDATNAAATDIEE